MHHGVQVYILKRAGFLKFPKRIAANPYYYLNESVHGAGDKVLAVGAERGRFDVGLGAKFNLDKKISEQNLQRKTVPVPY